jgi:succinoglycan biosynthesis protein ExoM
VPEVVVAIPTFRRPKGLARLLAALEKLETSAHLIVVVADNDAEGHAGYDLCRSLCTHYRWPLDPIIAEERGIAQARNALVTRALSYPDAQFVAMLDDDEWPSPGWLDELLRVQERTSAEIVEGSVLFDLPPGAPASTRGFDGLASIRRPTGPIAMLEGAGNLLMTRTCLARLEAPWFDPAFALSGGEDRDFFERVKAAGGRFAWADEAVARAAVPEARTSLAWMLRRAYGIGNADMRIFLKYRPRTADRLREYGKIALALLLSPVLFVILAVVPNRAADALRRFFRNAGKVSALIGRRYNAYAVTNGE